MKYIYIPNVKHENITIRTLCVGMLKSCIFSVFNTTICKLLKWGRRRRGGGGGGGGGAGGGEGRRKEKEGGHFNQ